MQDSLDSDLFWARDGRYCGDIPLFWRFGATGTGVPSFLLYQKTLFFEAHLLSSEKTWQLCSPKSYKSFMEPSYTIVTPYRLTYPA